MMRAALLGMGVAFAALVPATAPAFAQVATTDAAKVQAGDYAVEPYHTRIVFSVSHMGFTTWYGDFSGASGTLNFDAKNPRRSALSISFPAASVTTTNAKLDDELKGAAWFDAAQYPTVSFKSTGIALLGHDQGRIAGDLTFHGVTRPVTLLAHFNGGGVNPLDKKYTIGFDATGTISRSAFGVRTYVPMIGDSVKLLLSGAFEAQS